MPLNESNRRRAERVAQDQMVTLTPCSSKGVGEPLRVVLRDFSPRGIGFIHTRSLPHGQQLIVTLEQRIGNVAHLLYQVVRSNQDESGEWWIGGEFLCIVSDAELRACKLPGQVAGAVLS